ncbi:DUF4132 domain-containing protein [Spirillospora sp. CA-255316]
MDDHMASDEDVLILPEGLRAELHPRRGGAAGPPVRVEEGSADWIARGVERRRERIEEVLAHSESDPELVARARRHLGGEPDPLGAAVVAAIVCGPRQDRAEAERRFAHGWAEEHGLAFAARALAELADLVMFLRLGVRPGGTNPPDAAALHDVRSLLAACGDDEYAAAEELLAGARRAPGQRVVASYLVPTRLDWVDQCCASPPPPSSRWMLLASLSTARHVKLLGPGLSLNYQDCWQGLFVTMADGMGAAAVPVLAAALAPGSDLPPAGHPEVLAALGVLPLDEAFAAMVGSIESQHAQAALLAAMERFPARAARVLAPATAGGTRAAALATEMLKAHLRLHPGLAASGDLPPAAREIAAAVARVPDAPPEEVPALLAAPPWTRERAPIVLKGLAPPAEGSLRWEPGEREAWADVPEGVIEPLDPHADLEVMARRFRAGKLNRQKRLSLIAEGPEDLVRPLLEGWNPGTPLAFRGEWWRPLVARFGLAMRPPLVKCALHAPDSQDTMLLPFLDAEVAALMAGWLTKAKVKRHALAWFARHGLDAVPWLVPAAVGKPVRPRREAEAALRMLAGEHGEAAVVDAARAHGGEAAEAVAAMLAADALEVRAAKVPAIGDWADPAALPQILLPGRRGALPAAATRHLMTMLALSKPGDVYPGVARAAAGCDPASLAEFAWSLFERWQMAGAPSADGWALTALGPLGDDGTVRRLTPLVRAWPGEHGHARAVKGLDVLAEIGTETALVHLHGIAERVKFRGLRDRAREKIGEIAGRLGLTPDQLGDRLVPDLGLDEAGTLVLDYGPRRFTVGFDEALRPYVTGEDGKRRKALPKPGKGDDQELAPEAYRRFAQLKKDARAAASDQVLRLERAMVTGRRWTPEEFRAYFTGHPLVRHIARRLVWAAEDGGRATAFRVAEDGTFADVADDAFTLPGTARVGIPHPLALGESVKAWSDVFADYEILQPFPQLARPVAALTEEERAGGRLARFEGATVPSGAVRGLTRRGWQLPRDSDGMQYEISLPLAAGLSVEIVLETGLYAGSGGEEDDQVLEKVTIEGDLAALGTPPLAVPVSEALADLERLTGTG